MALRYRRAQAHQPPRWLAQEALVQSGVSVRDNGPLRPPPRKWLRDVTATTGRKPDKPGWVKC
jgi:hypothetical protein